MNKKMFKKKTKTQKPKTVLEVLDEQIAVAQQDAAKILAEKGSQSCEYSRAIDNLTALAEQRANVAQTVPQRKKVDPNAVIAGGSTILAGLGSTFLMMVYDQDQVVPKWFKNRVADVRDFFKTDK